MDALTGYSRGLSRSRHYKKSRDDRILMYLLHNGFATTERIGHLFWKTTRDHNHRRRLRHLRRLGLVESHSEGKGGRLLYRLSKKGVRHLRGRGLIPQSFLPIRHLPKYTFRHDNLLQDLRLILESSPAVHHFLREPEVRQLLAKRHGYQKERDSRYKVPDAIFTLQTQKKRLRVALELEIARKSKARTDKMLKLLATHQDFDTVFFVVESHNLITSLKDRLAELRHKDPTVRGFLPQRAFYFVPLADFLANRLNAVFEGEGQTFTLAEFGSDHA